MGKKKIAIFCPGDYRAKPNSLAKKGALESVSQMQKALKKLGYESYVVEGFISKPHEAIEKLSNINDPMIGIYTHWVYGPNTTEGVSGKDNPLLLASNFSGTWPGLVGLLNTASCLEYLNRKSSRIWTDAKDWTEDKAFMENLSKWCETGKIEYSVKEVHNAGKVSEKAKKSS